LHGGFTAIDKNAIVFVAVAFFLHAMKMVARPSRSSPAQ